MTEDLNKMETEIDAMLADLSDKLDVKSNPVATKQAKIAVRLLLDESWLAGLSSPTPSADTLKRVRETIDNELQKTPRTWLQPRIWAPLAAAAIIAICVGLLNYVHVAQDSQPATVNLDMFVQALEETCEEDSFSLAVDMDLNAIEYSINNLATNSEYQYEILDDIGNQIDELFKEPEWLENTSTGAIG